MGNTPDRFVRRMAIAILGICLSIAVVNGATLYVTLHTKSELERRIDRLELDNEAQKRKNIAFDRFVEYVVKAIGAK